MKTTTRNHRFRPDWAGPRLQQTAASLAVASALLFAGQPAQALLGSLGNLLNNTILAPIVSPVTDPILNDVLQPVVEPLLGRLLEDLNQAGLDPLLGSLQLSDLNLDSLLLLDELLERIELLNLDDQLDLTSLLSLGDSLNLDLLNLEDPLSLLNLGGLLDSELLKQIDLLNLDLLQQISDLGLLGLLDLENLDLLNLDLIDIPVEVLTPAPEEPVLSVLQVGTGNILLGVTLPVLGVNVITIRMYDQEGRPIGEDRHLNVLDLANINFNLDNLLPGTTYTVQVILTDLLGEVIDVIAPVIDILPLDPLLGPGDVVTAPATDIMDTSATLNGEIANAGIATFYWFEYGRTESFGSQTAPFELELLSGGTPSPVSTGISNLTPATTYYFRLVALNMSGRTNGNTLSFTTNALGGNLPPVAVDDAAFTRGNDSVTIDVLSNDYDPNGDPISIVSNTSPTHGTAQQNGNVFVYTPGLSYRGQDSFTYTITDGNGNFDTASVVITDFGIATTGIYNGLAINALPRNENQAFVRIKLNRKGAFTGFYRIAGTRRTFRGRFDVAGNSSVTVTRRQRVPVNMQLSLSPIKNAIEGFVYADGFGSQLRADKAAFNHPRPGSPYTGRYTLGFTPSSMQGAPQGSGHAAATSNKRGNTRVAGRLADDTPFIASAYISGAGRLPLYANLFGKNIIAQRGSFSGWQQIENFQTSPSPNLSIVGGAHWFKPLQPKARFNPAFNTTVGTVGSRYSIPTAYQLPITVVNPQGVLTMVLTGGNLVNPVARQVVLGPRALVPATPGSVDVGGIKINRRTGTFTGRLFSTVGLPMKVSGVFNQRDSFGIGYFTGLTQTGTVLILEDTDD